MGLLDSLGKVAGLAAGIGGTIFGAIKSGQVNKKYNRFINDQLQRNEARWNNSQNYFDTNQAQAVLEQARKNLVDRNKATESKAAITGATDEAAIAAQTANQEAYNQQLSNLAAQGDAYTQAKEAQYLAAEAALNQQKGQMYQQQAGSAANLAANASDIFSGNSLLSSLYKDDNTGAGIK